MTGYSKVNEAADVGSFWNCELVKVSFVVAIHVGMPDCIAHLAKHTIWFYICIQL